MAVTQRFAIVPIAQLRIGKNVRHETGELGELVESIRTHGILEPLVACPSEDGTVVEVLMGQRRATAARLAGLTEVPCMLRARPDDRDRVLMQLAENLDRAPMSPIDEALAFEELLTLGISRRAIANTVHRSESDVGNRIRLLDLPECLRIAVDVGWITPHAALEAPRALISNREAVARLAKVVRNGNEALRSWIRDEARAHTVRTGTKIVRKGVRVIPLSVEAYEVAKRRSEAAGQTLGGWVESLVWAAEESTRQERGAA